MNREIEILKQTRSNILAATENLSIEQLIQIPEGYNNNIAWNMGHTLVVQQMLCYTLSSLRYKVPTPMIDMFKKGTEPNMDISETMIEDIRSNLEGSIEVFEKDLSDGIFKTFIPYTTSYGTNLESIDDAITFNNVHEGVHLGYILALKRSIR